jgi:hypothetical protein
VSVLDRKRAPVLHKESSARLPARDEREAILARARAALASKPAAPAPALPVATKSAAPARQSARVNLPVAASRAVPAKSRPLPAKAGMPAVRPGGQKEVPPAAGSQVVEVPAQNGAPGSNQTIIVQVNTPQPVFPWWYGYGPYWWGYHPAPCSSRKCPRRESRPCTSWFCD